jgi:polyhydroxybutyrate depolymerase
MRLLAVYLALIVMSACGGDSGSGQTVPLPPSGLSYPTPQNYTVGTAIAPIGPTVSGTVVSYSVSPALPAGLTFNTANGQIAGTPSVVAATASYIIAAQNGGGSASFTLSITVNSAAQSSLQPTTGTTIGVAQSINVFFALRDSAAAAFPRYIDPTLIGWSTSNPTVASISVSGVVTGLSEGTSTITAQYQTFSTPLTVQVSGVLLTRNVTVAGQGTRRYSIYVPAFGNDNAPHAALVSMHGGGGTAMIQAATSQLSKFAQQQRFYVAFLEGTGVIQTFNAGSCCGSAQTQNVDDVLYVRTVLDDLQANFNVDAARLYATGFSNGAMMSHRLACALSDRIAAIAAIGGGSGQFDRGRTQYYACNPARPIPVLQIHAANDRNYPIAGGVGDGLSATDFYPIDATVADWLARNNLTNQAITERVTPTTTCRRYTTVADSSRTSARVTLCTVDPPDVYDAVNRIVFGGGHSWPGGVRSISANSDVPITDFDANTYMWAFFNP